MMMITQEELKGHISYDHITGEFMWATERPGRNASKPPGSVNRRGYLVIRIAGTSYSAHRLAWLYVHGEMPVVIDHINRDKTDNRIKNLSNTTMHYNMRNKALYKRNKSGVHGVRYDSNKRKWSAQIPVNGRCRVIGRFDTKEGAIKARKDAERECEFHENHGKDVSELQEKNPASDSGKSARVARE